MARRQRSWHWIGIVLVLTTSTAIVAEEPVVDRVGDLGAPDRLVIRGLVSIDPQRLRRPLVADDELFWLARPERPRQALLDGLALKAVQGLKLAGFATVAVVPSVETIDGEEHPVLTVTEGPRFEAGEIVVHGLEEGMAARLAETLRTSLPGESSIPEFTDRPDGGTTVTWLDRKGHPAPPDSPAWPRRGHPECHDEALVRIKSVVRRFLRDEGFLAITAAEAPATARRYDPLAATLTDPGIEAALDISDGRSAKLVVSIGALPPRSTLTRIEVPRQGTTTGEELVRFLGIRLGETVTQRDRLEWIGRLRDSARFLRHEVALEPDPLDPAATIAVFDLEEYAPMMPLSRPLSREEETLLRTRRWILGAAADQDRDLVIGMKAYPGSKVECDPCQIVVSASRGTALLIEGAEGRAHGFVTAPGRCSVIAPNGAGWFDLTLPARDRHSLVFQLSYTATKHSGTPARRPFERQPVYRHTGVAYHFLRSQDTVAGFGVNFDVPPSACGVLLHEGDVTTRWEGNDLLIERPGRLTTRVDATTGRVESLDLADYLLTIDLRRGALDEAERRAFASGRSLGEPGRPFSSALRFLAQDCCPMWLETRLASEEPEEKASEERRTRWRRFVAGAARVIGNWDRSEVFAPIDEWFVRYGSLPAGIPSDDDLSLPVLRLSGSEPPSGMVATVASAVCRWSERHLGGDAWPTAITRAYVGSLGGKETFRRELDSILASDEFGPLAHLGLALAFRNGPLATTFARRGMERCTPEAFRADCAALRHSVTPIDGLVEGLIEGLDDEAIRDLGTWLAGDPEMLLPLAEELRRGLPPAPGGTQATLDAWWEAGLGALVARCLDRLATPATAPGESGPILALEPLVPGAK